MTIAIEQLNALTADDRIKYLRVSVSKIDPLVNVDTLVEKIVDKYLPSEQKPNREKVIRAVGFRVDDHLSAPGANWGGHALDHMVEGNNGFLSQQTYTQLYAHATGIAGFVYDTLGYQKQASDAYQVMGRLLARLQNKGLTR